MLKVFGKGCGEEPFLRKVCPTKKGEAKKTPLAGSSFCYLMSEFILVDVVGRSEVLSVLASTICNARASVAVMPSPSTTSEFAKPAAVSVYL